MSRDYSGWTAERFKEEVEEIGVKTRGELQKKDTGLYCKGYREGWLDNLFGGSLQRNYSGWTAERYTREVKSLNLKSRSVLHKKEPGLYMKGLKEGWLDAVFGEPLRHDFSGWGVKHFKEEIETLGVKSRSELKKKDPVLYNKGCCEGWLGAAFGEPLRHNYSGWTFERYKKEVEASGSKSRSELNKKASHLYLKGCREGWLDGIYDTPDRKPRRDYSVWTVERFKREIEVLGVENRNDLEKKDCGLYKQGRKEGWLDGIFGEPLNRDFSGWTLEQFKQEVESVGVNSRHELEKKDSSLYNKGWKEGWLSVVFGEPLRRDFSGLTVESFKKMVKSLGVKSRSEFLKKDRSLYQKGFRDGWLDIVFPQHGSLDSLLQDYVADGLAGKVDDKNQNI